MGYFLTTPKGNMDIQQVLIFLLILGNVALVVNYITMTHFINSTIFDVSEETVSIRHKPLPWYGHLTLFSADMDQLFCKQDITRYKNKYPTYCLNARMKDGKERTLISWLDTSEQALFVEQEIEKFLNIKNKPVFVFGEIEK
ncbi:MAG: hypothetical protein ABRQ39_07530 [Candidatus Eremiobacterota bacterium]